MDIVHVNGFTWDLMATTSVLLGPSDVAAEIETIDMARRALHNEGSDLLKERLKGKVQIDFDTARRLFTLICVLHIKG